MHEWRKGDDERLAVAKAITLRKQRKGLCWRRHNVMVASFRRKRGVMFASFRRKRGVLYAMRTASLWR